MSSMSNRPGRRCAPKRSGRHANVFAGVLALASLLLASTIVQASPPSADAPLDLNQATAAQLEALPGIGEVKAAAILAVRKDRGGFSSVDELESVRGIGPALTKKLRPMVKVGAKSRSTARSGGGS